jgi:acetolactate synthase I/II/III large subunit
MTGNGAQALVAALASEGVDLIFGYPGGCIMPTYDALLDAPPGLRHVLVRHEQGAIHAAQGYARVSGKPGVCLVTSGPGATNLVTGLQDALMDSTPIVCITGQVPSPMLGTDAFQECDVIGLTLQATKWSYQVTRAAEIPGIVARAFRIAREGRPGPVVIDITKDAQLGAMRPDDEGPPPLPARRLGVGRDLGGLEAAADLINAAQRPFLLAGHGVTLSGAETELRELAERAGIPVACTLLGLSAFSADHPLYTGMLGMHGSYGANRLTGEADVIVAVGMRFDDRVTGRLDRFARQARVVHIEIDPTQVGRHVPADVALVADAREALTALLPRIRPAEHRDWLARFRAHDEEEWARVIEGELRPGGGALRMAEVIDTLSRASAGEAIVVSDVGQHQMAAARYYGFRRSRGQVTSGGLGTMGFALPAAIGAKLAAPGREVIAVIGDGGFQMCLQELGTVMQERLPVKVVILDNGHLGMVRQWQELFFDRRYSSVAMENPDFVAIARAYRIAARTIAGREDLEAAVAELLAAPGPMLLHVPVEAAGNVFPMVPAGAAVTEIRLA